MGAEGGRSCETNPFDREGNVERAKQRVELCVKEWNSLWMDNRHHETSGESYL